MSSIPPTFEIRKIIENIEDEKYRYALMYQFLIGGGASEVCGKYKPSRTDVSIGDIQINNEKINAVFFKVKSARRKGKLRLCALPLDNKIEPWTKLVLDWFKKHENNCPFIFSEKATAPRSNEQYLIYFTEKLFKHYRVPLKNFIRNSRKRNLINFYHFNSLDLVLFGMWNEPTIDPYVKKKINSFLLTKQKMDPSELKIETEKYFIKLLRPISQLKKEDDPTYLQVRDYLDLYSRHSRAAKITKLIEDINFTSLKKLNTPFLNEKMRIVLDIISPCDNNEDLFSTKIIKLATLFEVQRDALRISDDQNIGAKNLILIERWLEHKNIPYNPEMLTTWNNIRDFRNSLAHYKRDPNKFFYLLGYFGQPSKMPPQWSNTWDSILDKFEISLEDMMNVLNSLP